MRATIVFPLLVALLAGCSQEMTDPVAQQSSPIVNGSLDTNNDAVVAWLHNTKCSAVIVHTVGTTGYALTAAQCVNGVNGTLRQGQNHAVGQFDVEYPVTDVFAHPNYTGNAYDVAILRFSGATAATPVMPILPASLDTLGAGTSVELVGYGLTSSGANTLRQSGTTTIDSESAAFLSFNQQNGQTGFCSGDSGGPVVIESGGTRYVAGIAVSITDQFCEDFSVAWRVSGMFDSFVQPYIDGSPTLPESCERCAESAIAAGEACETAVNDCQNSAECTDYLNCVNTCPDGACISGCAITHPDGFDLRKAVDDCSCTECLQCDSEPFCQQPLCLLTAAVESCQGCTDASCCTQAEACAADADCRACETGALTGADCANNSAFDALQMCRSGACPQDCPVDSDTPDMGNGGADMGPGEPDMGAPDMGTAAQDMGMIESDMGVVDSDMGTSADSGGTNNEGSSSGEEGGCSTPGAQPGWLTLIAAGLFVAVRRRFNARSGAPPLGPRAS